jgi:hypothetical protein
MTNLRTFRDVTMPTEEEGRSRSAKLEQAIRHQIAQRTRVGIQTLEVEVIGNRVVIRGSVPCYYLKQLVLQGVLDVVGSEDATQIELNVQVACSPPKSDAQDV